MSYIDVIESAVRPGEELTAVEIYERIKNDPYAKNRNATELQNTIRDVLGHQLKWETWTRRYYGKRTVKWLRLRRIPNIIYP